MCIDLAMDLRIVVVAPSRTIFECHTMSELCPNYVTKVPLLGAEIVVEIAVEFIVEFIVEFVVEFIAEFIAKFIVIVAFIG